MAYEISDISRPVVELYPPKKNGIFENVLKFAELIIDNNPLTPIVKMVCCGIETYGIIKEMEYKANSLSLISDYNQAIMKANLESKKIDKNYKLVNLYIEKQFQENVYAIQSEYEYKKTQLISERNKMYYNIQQEIKVRLRDINANYSSIIREHELKFTAYREYINCLNRENISYIEAQKETIKYFMQHGNAFTDDVRNDTVGLLKMMISQHSPKQIESYIQMENKL